MTAAAITGIGCVTGYGIGASALWSGLLSGASAIRQRGTRATACAPSHAELLEHAGRPASGPPPLRTSLLARLAALEAWQASGASGAAEPWRCGVMMNRNFGQHEVVHDYYTTLWKRGPSAVSGLAFVNTIANTVLGEVALALQLRGPSVLVFGSSLLGTALDVLRAEAADVMLVGAVDEVSDFVADLCDANGLTLEARGVAADPRVHHSPATGFRLGDGAAFVVLERLEHALARGAPIVARLRGCGSSFSVDAACPFRRTVDDVSAAVTSAIADAGVEPAMLGVAALAASGLEDYDDVEALALETVGARPAAAAIKTAVGETFSVAPVLATIACALMLRHRLVVPTPAPRPTEASLGIALSMEPSGANDCVVVERHG